MDLAKSGILMSTTLSGGGREMVHDSSVYEIILFRIFSVSRYAFSHELSIRPVLADHSSQTVGAPAKTGLAPGKLNRNSIQSWKRQSKADQDSYARHKFTNQHIVFRTSFQPSFRQTCLN